MAFFGVFHFWGSVWDGLHSDASFFGHFWRIWPFMCIFCTFSLDRCRSGPSGPYWLGLVVFLRFLAKFLLASGGSKPFRQGKDLHVRKYEHANGFGWLFM